DTPTVLIVSDDVEFSRLLSARWQSERMIPAFTLMSADLCHDLDEDGFDIAIIGSIQDRMISAVLTALEGLSRPAIFVSENRRTAEGLRRQRPKFLVLHKGEDWLDSLILVAGEALRRCEALTRAHRAEQANAALERQATLGRYVLE